jgi:prolipoprotein diacylglyceryltransferase
MEKRNAFLSVLLGMILGTIIPVALFYVLDSSKGWNPFGWWFIATFGCAIVGGVIGLFLFGYLARRNVRRKLA